MCQVLWILVINLKEVKPTIQYNALGPKNKTIILVHLFRVPAISVHVKCFIFLQIWCCTGNIHIFISSQSYWYLSLIILWMQLVYNKHKVKNQCYYLWQTETKVNLKGCFSFVSCADFSWTSTKLSWN